MQKLQELEEQAERKKYEYARKIISTMTVEELKEICTILESDCINDVRIEEIWNRAEQEYKKIRAAKK